jgi:hypothetical protein
VRPISPATSATARSTLTSSRPDGGVERALSARSSTSLLRGAAILLAGVVALAVGPPIAVADNGIQLTIKGGAGRPVTRAQLEAVRDVDPVTTTSHPVGGTEDVILRGGTSALALAELVHIPPAALSATGPAMTVTLAGETPVTLGKDEIENGLTGERRSPAGPRSATFDAGYSDVVRFFKPLASPGGNTFGFDPPIGRDLQVDINTTGDLIDVTVDADERIEPGDRVIFSATANPAPSGADVVYEWDFGDGSALQQTTGLGSQHVYAAKGTFEARLTVTTSGGSSGTDAVKIQVGTPDAGPGQSAPPGPPAAQTGAGGTPGGGGRAKSGGGNGGAGAPATGHASGSKKQTAAGRKRATSTGKRTTPAAKRKKPTPAKRRAAADRAATAPPVPATGKPKTGGARRRSDGAADRQREPKPAPPPEPGPGRQITGILLAGTSPFQSALPALKPASADELARTAARAAAGNPGGLLGWAGVGGLAIAVLFGGAGVEMRALARRVRHPVTPPSAA